MHPLLIEIDKTNGFVNSKGEKIEVHSHTPFSQCQFLQGIIKKNNFKKGIESGLAFGVSTLAILEAITLNGGTHCAVDKYEASHWGNRGIELITQAGYTLEFIEDHSYIALPKLFLEGRKFDFSYIDTTKVFDLVLMDFFFIDKMLEIGGIIVFDDANFPGIRKVVRYISQLPHYKIYAQYPMLSKEPLFKKVANKLKFIPYSGKILSAEILKTNFELGVNAGCLAFQKIDNDKRNWDWNILF